ncbi:hypothetical protein CAPTEDRAFT_212057 [Capitella teleta]|uniref:Large ribosomal subunit protein bL9m n=1 Tax=Capitella teleta TaxID=283909 RepID=R7UPH4_CAPTE|nr:hypothetical protein CAPTEDRAFT_212057 [Capitella teleta]|eukprot:ELU05321.1 hypothetical protein CAPTEDRAFT_212057 [Capitella teleta]
MQLILTVDIEGIGFKGETVTVSKRVGRNYLLISGAAVYVTPENLAKWAEIRKNLPKTVTQSIWARKTMRRLSEMNLPIPMHPRHPWTLSPAHVVVAFRKQGVELNESCIILPEEPIKEHGPAEFQVLVNGKDTVEIHALIFPIDLENPDDLPEDFPPVWGDQTANMTDIVLEALARNQAANSPSS